MKTELLFPAMDAFSFSVSHGEPLTHTRSYASLLIAESDTVALLGHRAYLLEHGDVLLSLPYSYMRTKDDLPFCGYEIRFPIDALRAMAPTLYLRSADGSTAQSFSKDTRDHLLSLCSSLAKRTVAPLYAIIEIFSILEQSASLKEESRLSIPLPKILRRALAYLNENPSEKMDVAALATRFDVSPSTLRRAFKDHLATTPTKYAKEVKLLSSARYQKNEVM